VANNIATKKQLWIPVRFEVRVVPRTVVVHMVVVQIDEISLRIPIQFYDNFIESGFRQQVIMIQECNEFARRQPKGHVAGSADIPVEFTPNASEPRITR